MNTAAAIRAHRGPAVFSVGLRPFFLFSALWAAIAAPLWLYAFLSGGPVGLAWHVHEMLFGYTAGVVVGFLLTAVPNWTGRLPVVGTPLALLFGLWLAGRAAMLATALNADLVSEVWPFVIDGLFLFAMAGVVWRECWQDRTGAMFRWPSWSRCSHSPMPDFTWKPGPAASPTCPPGWVWRS